MTITNTRDGLLACVENDDLFQNALLDDPAKAQTAAERRLQASLLHRAENLCLDCPVMVDCLYRAIVQHDVAGFCAGTTQRQRLEMRKILGIHVEPENLDSYAGASPAHQVDHDEVLRLRRADPTASLESIAQQLGSSLSTVKRHLRKARRGEPVGRPKVTVVPPSVEQVLDAYRQVVANRPAVRPVRKAA